MLNKQTEEGGSLPELLVVLAVTVVMAAILLPAVIGPSDSQVDAATTVDRMVLDGPVGLPSVSMDDRYASRHGNTDRTLDAETPVEVGALPADAQREQAELQIEKTGLEKMKTTDISYVIP